MLRTEYDNYVCMDLLIKYGRRMFYFYPTLREREENLITVMQKHRYRQLSENERVTGWLVLVFSAY